MAVAATPRTTSALESRDAFALALLTIVVLAGKLPTLGTPLYWDEMAWTSQARWLSERSLRLAIPGLRPADIFWGHPPALHLTLAALTKVFGFSIVLAHVVSLAFAVVGIWFTYLLGRLLYDERTGIAAALFLFLSPIYFAQSGMFLADAPVMSLGVASTYFALRRRYYAYLVTATYMALIKETSIALLIALLLYLALEARPRTRAEWLALAKYALPLVALGAFVAWQKLTTGHFFFIYDPRVFDVALFHLTWQTFTAQLPEVVKWIFLLQGRWLFSLLIVLHLALAADARRRPELRLFALICLFSGFSFSVLYMLARYLLPVLPYFYLLGAWSLLRLVARPRWQTAAVAGTLAFTVWSLATQPLVGNGETSLRYLDVVRVHREMGEYIAAESPDARVLTAWPHTSELFSPHLGYVPRGLRNVSSIRQQRVGDRPDLILVSMVPPVAGMAELRARALNEGWRLVKRVDAEPIVSELYARPAAAASKTE